MAWAALAGVAVSALSSYFGGRSQKKAQEKAAKYQFLANKYSLDMQRYLQLHQRRQREGAIGMYRDQGTQGLGAPAYTVATPPTNPFSASSSGGVTGSTGGIAAPAARA